MRRSRDAPVDVIGAAALPDPSAQPKVQRYQVLISLMLSSQTRDEQTAIAMRNLQSYGLTVQSILDIPEGELEGLIQPVGFYKRKAGYIKKTTQILSDEYDGDIPSTINDLVKLPGVGPKMGHLCMSIGWDKQTGIGVDTHVHRIANRLKWVKRSTKEPEDTRRQLEDWLPKYIYT
jgi:endonuclease-3